MKTLKQVSRITLLSMAAILLNGCFLFVAGAGAGAGAVWYYGALKSTEEADHKTVFEAAKGALEELEIPVQTTNVDATVATIEGETADSKQVNISVKRLTENTSELVIRVGLSDEARARLIYDKTKARLPGVEGSLPE